MKRVEFRASARNDIQSAIRYYRNDAGEKTAISFIAALENAYKSIGSRPAAASLFYSFMLGLPGLRTKPVRKYPYLIFFVERADHIDVWRVLHTRRDISRTLSPPGDP